MQGAITLSVWSVHRRAAGWTTAIPSPAMEFSSRPPERLWGPTNIVFIGYRGLFPHGWGGWGVKLTAHLHPVPRSKLVELYLNSPIRLHGLVLNWAQGQLYFVYIHTYTTLVNVSLYSSFTLGKFRNSTSNYATTGFFQIPSNLLFTRV
jgi:hypothetical protein